MKTLRRELINQSNRIAYRNDVTSTQLDVIKDCYFRYWTIDGQLHELRAGTPFELLAKIKEL